MHVIRIKQADETLWVVCFKIVMLCHLFNTNHIDNITLSNPPICTSCLYDWRQVLRSPGVSYYTRDWKKFKRKGGGDKMEVWWSVERENWCVQSLEEEQEGRRPSRVLGNDIILTCCGFDTRCPLACAFTFVIPYLCVRLCVHMRGRLLRGWGNGCGGFWLRSSFITGNRFLFPRLCWKRLINNRLGRNCTFFPHHHQFNHIPSNYFVSQHSNTLSVFCVVMFNRCLPAFYCRFWISQLWCAAFQVIQ